MTHTAVLLCGLVLTFTFFEAKAYEVGNERVENVQGPFGVVLHVRS